MTEEQFYALTTMIKAMAVDAAMNPPDPEASKIADKAEQIAHDLFCGKTHEQPK